MSDSMNRDYVPGPEEPEQAPPSPDYVPGPEHTDDKIIAEDASPTAQSLDYVSESDTEADPDEDDDEDLEEDPVDYSADRGDGGDDEDEPSEKDEDDDVDIEDDDDEEEEEHLAPASSVVVALPATDQAPSAEETESFETDESAATPPPHPAYRVTARISIPGSSGLTQNIPSLPLPSIPSPSLPVSPPLPVSSPVPVLSPSPPPSHIRSLGYRATMIWLRAKVASTSHSLPLPPPFILSPTRSDAPSLGIPPPLPISVLTSSPPLLLPSASHREDRPEVTLPPRKRLDIALGPRYEVEESSSAAARPAGGLRADYGFIATIDREIRRDPERELVDQDGITSIPTTEIFEQLALMGYHTDSDKLTFQKGAFSPQWRFLIHNILHCLSPKKTAWEQFSSNIATAIICLATNRKFNFSRMIFEHMVSNISSPHKFLMYPRSTKGFLGQEVGLFPNMLAVTTPSTSPSRITSSPSPTPSPSPEPSHTQPSPTQPSPTQLSPTQPGTERHSPTPHDLPLHVVHSYGSDEEADLMKTKKTYSSAYTKLILRVKKLEAQIKVGKARRQARVVLSDTEVVEDDSSKQGRKFSDEGVQDDEGVQEKASTDTEIFVQEVTPTEVIQDQEGSEKASDEVSTAGAKKGTASEEVPIVSTAEVSLSTAGGTVTYTRRSAEKRSRQDKGKAIMIEEEPKKKSKKELEQERLSYAEAIRLEEQMNEEQRAQIARDAEIARQWDEEERKRVMDEAKTAKKIDWNDPSVIRYHTQKMKPKTVAQARRNMIKYLKNQGNYKIRDFKGMSYNDIRPIFEKVWDFNQNIEPMDAEHGSEKQQSPTKEKSPEKVVEEEIDTQEELKEAVKEPGAKRKKSIPRKTTRKRQKLEEDAEKDELKGFLDIVPREEAPIEIESISTKFPIVDWKTCVLTETFMYYQVFRGDGSSKNYKVLSEMLEDFDRLDVEELFRLVKERYSTSRPEGFDLMLWGDLHTLFEPDEDDEIWRDQHEYNLLSWRLCDFCGIHILLMENGLAIHMLTEKKYPLSQEMLTKMLSKKLEVDHESS
ncbi:hypothetical protein Tco_0856906 [Tanacetum coccineum]|uniref:Synaptobrevin, longin-like domain protein n=1 Tax=Tanacetum coccineum TaxID=301880 RepID=A0ABQ5BAB2_9ASTR